MGAAPQRDLSAVLREMEEAAPRLYSRWSAMAWRLVCRGPALRLWDALGDSAEGRAALEDYLFLAREAIGMQYLTATRAEDLEPGAPAHGFLAVMLCETLPRLLPTTPAAARAGALARVWNAGEKLVGKPVWLDRYLAARLPELAELAGFEEFLVRVVGEGLDDRPPATWQGEAVAAVVDPSAFDRAFLPGAMHLAAPTVLCVHDVRREGRQVAVLLRRGKSVCLGVTPCLGGASHGSGAAAAGGAAAGAAAAAAAERALVASAGFIARARRAQSLPEARAIAIAPSGFVVFSTPLSQRLWVLESAA